jgi:hypothetical protein
MTSVVNVRTRTAATLMPIVLDKDMETPGPSECSGSGIIDNSQAENGDERDRLHSHGPGIYAGAAGAASPGNSVAMRRLRDRCPNWRYRR